MSVVVESVEYEPLREQWELLVGHNPQPYMAWNTYFAPINR
jgi:hypothetical protein